MATSRIFRSLGSPLKSHLEPVSFLIIQRKNLSLFSYPHPVDRALDCSVRGPVGTTQSS